MVCSYNLVTMFIPLNSFETWVAFYDGETESLFLGVKTICEILNMILFLVYIVILMMKDRRERERIQLLNAQLQKANEQLHEFAQEKELMGETKERNRLAREIHDTLGHILTGISVGIDTAMDRLNDLTRREIDVLKLLAEGLFNKEIASRLNISERTVKNHVSNIFKKISVSDRTQAAVFAIKNNLIKISY